MITRQSIKRALFIAAILVGLYLLLVALLYFRQRSLLFFPSHHQRTSELKPWKSDERTIGYCREVPNARTVWLMLHGNAGQAADRSYVLPRMSPYDSLYVMEYPGYGLRAGSPGRESMNEAAAEAYRLLRAENPDTPICVLGESIGSGPACVLAAEEFPPDKIVLVVPFDSLSSVASAHFGHVFPARLLLCDAWDNVASLRDYSNPVDIFGAKGDDIIPIAHAEALAASIPTARFTAITGGHNDWSANPQVTIER